MSQTPLDPNEVVAELGRMTALARQYSDKAEERVQEIKKAGNVLTAEQNAAMSTMYSSSVMNLMIAQVMAGFKR